MNYVFGNCGKNYNLAIKGNDLILDK